MDYLRSLWALDQSRVGFHEYGEAIIPPSSSSPVIPDKKYSLKTELLKLIPLSVEHRHSGKNRLRYRAVVAVGDGQGKVGLGSSTHRSKEIALERAETFAKANMIEIKLTFHPSTPGKNHTLAQDLTGSYKDLEVTLKPAPQGTGLLTSPMAKVVLKLPGVEDCLMSPRASVFDSTTTMAFGLFAALEQDRI